MQQIHSRTEETVGHPNLKSSQVHSFSIPADFTALGQVESGKGDTSDRDEDTPSKKKKSSHKSRKKSFKPGKSSSDFKDDLKNLDNKSSERSSQLEAIFLAKSFTVLVELAQKSDVVATERPFIPPVQRITGVSGEMTQETQPVEAPVVTTVMQPTGQYANYQIAAVRPEVQPPGLASQIFPSDSGGSEV